MSRNIPACRTWRVTFTDRTDQNRETHVFYVQAPTRQLALWEGREQFFGAWMMAHPQWSERVGRVPDNTRVIASRRSVA